MLEHKGDMFQPWLEDLTSVLCITTNGCVNNDKLVMGAGVAKTVLKYVPDLPALLGEHVAEFGNTPCFLPEKRILSWPTKPGLHTAAGRSHPGWQCQTRVKSEACESAVSHLTASSGHSVKRIVAEKTIPRLILPRPGCGLGGLDWDGRVGPWMRREFNDTFEVYTL